MIKLEANSTVLTALQIAFTKPANSAESALNKYILAIEDMLNEALLRGRDGFDSKFDLYSISLQKLANKAPQMGPEKIRIHAWLKKNGYELVKMVCQSALKSIHLTASNNVQQLNKVIPFSAPFYAA